jgi:hypothetical protein
VTNGSYSIEAIRKEFPGDERFLERAQAIYEGHRAKHEYARWEPWEMLTPHWRHFWIDQARAEHFFELHGDEE